MAENIRNFSIIAHIDHGKSTLADRLLEITNTIEKRKMREQVLDSMELEKERGITIKMTPVRMRYKNHILNLIDTPGHIDFSYEVSRALKAVEGALLLVDATQGVQAQTLTTLDMARDLGLVIIPAVSKIDSPLAKTNEVKDEIAKILDCSREEVLGVSGKTGEGVVELIEKIIESVPSPSSTNKDVQALIFDFQYSSHRGVIVYTRLFSGEIKKGDDLLFIQAKERFTAAEVGVFIPEEKATEILSAGEIGYIVTGIKKPRVASVGDTVTQFKKQAPALLGYERPKPVVWASLYPESQDIDGQGAQDFNLLRQALERLSLSDSSFTFEEESSGVLGRGFRSGFLGMLHLEIITERLKREFNLRLIVTTPSITYEVLDRKGVKHIIYSPTYFPDYGEIEKIREPWAKASIITPAEFLGEISKLLYEHEAVVGDMESFGDNRTTVHFDIPLRELMRNFFDKIKSISKGYASMNYSLSDYRDADVVKLEILVAEEVVPAFSRIVSRRRVEIESEMAVEKLHKVLPKQLFATKIQAKAMGRIISSRTLSAMRKDVTGYLYGGDVTRKMKLLEKQKKGKKRLKERGRVNIPHEIFLKMIKE